MMEVCALDELPAGVPLYIFGAGRGGRLLLQVLGPQRVAGFIDNRQTGTVDGVAVTSIAGFRAGAPAGARVVIASQYVYDIVQDLRAHGITDAINAYPLVRQLIAAGDDAPSGTRAETADARLARLESELDALYALLYTLIHDRDRAPDLAALQSREAFDTQWRKHPDGEAMLSDAWFRDNVERLIADEELQIRRAWFAGRSALDCGCGTGRWSYGLARLGMAVTAVDVNESALEATRAATSGLGAPMRFVRSELESLDAALPADQRFDLVWCWGVLPFVSSFTASLESIARRVSDDGILYLYLFGREKMPFAEDLAHFKLRVRYNTLQTSEERYNFLLQQAGGDPWRVHQKHDALAPLIGRRFHFAEVEAMLRRLGFATVTRVKQHPELFIRATRRDEAFLADHLLPDPGPPYWMERY